ncbi:sucrase ferredoxin, partial [Streptomyces albidoflavus]
PLHPSSRAGRRRPAARALSQRHPELVWESTHVGGDRFAANVVALPDGVYYGGLDAATAVTTVEQHLADRINAAHLRGYTDLVPAQQVAVAAALHHFGPAGRHAWTVTATTRLDDHWHVHLTGHPPHPATLDVEVHSHRTPPRQLTCRGLARSSTVVYEATGLRRS